MWSYTTKTKYEIDIIESSSASIESLSVACLRVEEWIEGACWIEVSGGTKLGCKWKDATECIP